MTGFGREQFEASRRHNAFENSLQEVRLDDALVLLRAFPQAEQAERQQKFNTRIEDLTARHIQNVFLRRSVDPFDESITLCRSIVAYHGEIRSGQITLLEKERQLVERTISAYLVSYPPNQETSFPQLVSRMQDTLAALRLDENSLGCFARDELSNLGLRWNQMLHEQLRKCGDHSDPTKRWRELEREGEELNAEMRSLALELP